MSVDLIELIESMLKSYNETIANKPIELIFEASPGLSNTVICDPTRLKIILVNLITNAINHTDHGKVTIKLTENNGDYTFSISDTGCGLSDTVIDKYMKSTVSLSYSEHTEQRLLRGIGLTVCKCFVEKMGGHLQCDSVVNQGTTFSFTIPLAQGVLSKTIIRSSVDYSKLSVLIISDAEHSYCELDSLLEDGEIKIFHHTTAEKFLDENDLLASNNIFILSNVVEKKTLNLCIDKIRPNIPDKKMLLFAEKNFRGQAKIAQEQGMAGYLTLPMTADVFANIIKAAYLSQGLPDNLLTKYSNFVLEEESASGKCA